MEKLQPVLKHKFWIIGGLALLVPFVGWWLDSGKVAGEIQSRWDTLSKLAAPSGSGVPNQAWNDSLETVNKQYAKRQRELERSLYESQTSFWFWPENIKDAMVGKEYRDDLGRNLCEDYREAYLPHFMDIVQEEIEPYGVDPVNPDEGLVAIPYATTNTPGVPRVAAKIHHVDASQVWSLRPPAPQELWDSQEDLWLIQSILNAIGEVNEGSRKISDAPIREIHTLLLRGGSPKPAVDPNAPPTDNMNEGMPGPGGDMPPAFGNLAFGNQPGTRGTATQLPQSASFEQELDQVFGPETVQATPGAIDGGDPTSIEPGMPGMPGMPGVGGQALAKRRYVHDAPELPYKTRGFYLHVTMLHDNLPKLQAALASMRWPTTLLRVQQVSRYHDFEPRTLAQQSNFGFDQPSMRNSPFSGGFPTGGGFNTPGMPTGQGRPGGSVILQKATTQGGDSLQAALQDPYLADVAIAGLMTIYRSPDIDEEAIQEQIAEEAAQNAAIDAQLPTPPPGEVPLTDPNAPVDPNAPPADPNAPPADPNAAPADPNAPSTEPPSNETGTPPNPNNPTPPTEVTPPAATETTTPPAQPPATNP